MEFSKTLIDLAKMSPKSYAKQIRARNTSLLKKLMMLKPYLGKPLTDIPDDVWKKFTAHTEYGCPHCNRCKDCLWSKATHSSEDTAFSFGVCAVVKFDGVSMNKICDCDFTNDGCVKVNYLSDMEYICIMDMDFSSKLDKVSWEKCVRFVKAHIEWAKLPIWGTKPFKRLNS